MPVTPPSKSKRMIRSISLFICFYLLTAYTSNAQIITPKQLTAKRTTQLVTIDGHLTDNAWKDAALATDFIEFRPTPFKKEDTANRTEVYIMYNDDGIFMGGYCHEISKDSIATELRGRDGFGNNDFIGAAFDTYLDKLNGFEYFITPLGEQMDAKISPSQPNSDNGGEDFSWNAVWESATAMHNDGWSFEMFIPFSAIRFSKNNIQTWGINIFRRRVKSGQTLSWNTIDVTVNGSLTQAGTWVGLSNIKPPLRLQFSPYLSFNANHNPLNEKKWSTPVNGGMDIKYGINQAFTLDATLVPDFGQVQSDNRVLNLTPFEVQFQENRPFFTEGTELFNKAGLFYTRRIGIDAAFTHSIDEYNVLPEEKITNNPAESKLINATKISGRTSKGLGIGILNAITNNRFATLEHTITGAKRNVLIEPLTNYSVVVVDQSLKNNSSFTFTNTNVLRSGADYDANVSAAQFSINDKKNKWNVSGKLVMSNLSGKQIPANQKKGLGHSLSFGKTSGNFTFSIQQDLVNRYFNGNDIGYFTITNFIDHSASAGYSWIKPSKWYNNLNVNFNFYHSLRLVSPAGFQGINLNLNANTQFKNLWRMGLMAGYEPKGTNYYEPREEGRYFRGWSNWYASVWMQTNDAKKYSLFARILQVDRSLYNSKRTALIFENNYRFNSKLAVNLESVFVPQKRNVGYATKEAGVIIFGRRDIKQVENILSIKYSFNNKMNINTRMRHYWSQVQYDQYFNLLPNGTLQSNNSFAGNQNNNINFFNVDMVYTWQFAPGSFLNAVWKNAAFAGNQNVQYNYFSNLKNTLQSDEINNFSLKVIYFIDYLQLRKQLRKKTSL
ncbi:MAG: hypothetical protein RIR12_1939 [Bacteroidota bacterium]|jgi:hypothetical protein